MARSALIVDPDPASGKLAQVVLRQAGWTATIATTAAAALAALAASRPDVVITSLELDDGAVLLAIARRASIAVAIVTSHDDAEVERRALAAGYALYLRKPIDVGTFALAITRALDHA